MTEHPFDNAIRQLIEARKRTGWSQLELEARIGLSDGLLAKYEAGKRKPSLPTLVMWSKALGCEIIVGGTGHPLPARATIHARTLAELHATGLSIQAVNRPVLRIAEVTGQVGEAMERLNEAVRMLEQLRRT